MLTLTFNIQLVKTEPRTIIVPDDYPTIQEAINNAEHMDTIFIRNGTYSGHFIVNKTLTIQGENKYSTIIYGSIGNSIRIESDNVNFSSLQIHHLSVYIDASNCIFSDCIMNGSACLHINGNYNIIRGNLITNYTECALTLSEGSHDNIILENTISNFLSGSMSATAIVEAKTYSNVIYHNNFIECKWYWALQTNANNTWYDNRTCEGNYWDNVFGNDTDGDGIIDGWVGYGVYERDYYPLINPYWCPGDINHDLQVNIFDVTKICIAYGSTPSNPNWNPHTDIAVPYGKIDIFDVVLCTTHYGETYS
jgi:nitrous oxidase accessory protein NosD